MQYNLMRLALNGRVLVEIRKGMYSLPQAGQLKHKQLCTHLAKYGCQPVPHIHGLWKHDTRKITFCLFVDDFGVKYTNHQDVSHLILALNNLYKTTVNWTESKFVGLTLDWDYGDANRSVKISIPDFVEILLRCTKHQPPTKPQDSSHPHVCPINSRLTQKPTPINTIPAINAAGKLKI